MIFKLRLSFDNLWIFCVNPHVVALKKNFDSMFIRYLSEFYPFWLALS